MSFIKRGDPEPVTILDQNEVDAQKIKQALVEMDKNIKKDADSSGNKIEFTRDVDKN